MPNMPINKLLEKSEPSTGNRRLKKEVKITTVLDPLLDQIQGCTPTTPDSLLPLSQ